MLVEKLDNGRRPVMAQQQPVGLFGVFLNAIQEKVPSQLASILIKGFGSLPPVELSFLTLYVGGPNSKLTPDI